MSREYKQPETRIKHVVDWEGERYYAQYKINWFWGWENILNKLLNKYSTKTLEEAKVRVDTFLANDYYRWQNSKIIRKKVKSKIEYIKYP